MSGDTQPKKRKDKKRKKDDEDTVKETTVHAPKQASAGAAQAAKEPGDIQMHVHSDHGTGGNWCAKVVFFILLAGLGALIGLIIMENQGVSNDDTPLSESRYSEFFNGWVDENRQDDHHHDEILAAINSLDDHDDEEVHHAVGDHDDDGHDDDHDGEDDHDDGAPYAEEDDHDDDEDVQDDDEDEGPAQKLDDDEVEEIFTQQEAAAQQEAIVAADDDDDDDNDGQADGDDDDDDDDDGVADANDKTIVDDDDDVDDDKNKEPNSIQDDDDENDDDDKNDNEHNVEDDDDDDDGDDVVTKTNVDDEDDDNGDIKENQQNVNDDDDDDEEGDEEDEKLASEIDNDDNEENDDDEDDEGVDSVGGNFEPAVRSSKADDDDDNDDNDVNEVAQETADVDDDQDDTPFDEERPNALNYSPNQNPRTLESSPVASEDANDSLPKPAETLVTDYPEPERDQVPVSSTTTPTDGVVTGDTLKDQMDELVRNYNKLAESLNVPKVEETIDTPETVLEEDDGDQDEIEEVTRGSQQATEDDDDDDDDNEVDDDDDKAAFNEFVDNDGGEEEYLEKVRSEQQRLAAAEEERRTATEPEEESSQIPSRAEEADRSYQEELRRAEQQLDEKKAQEALAAFDRIILRKPNSIPALIGRARSLDALAEQRRSNAILTEAIVAYRSVIEQELAVDDATLRTIAERCLDRMRFQGQHAKAVEVHKVLIRRFDNEPAYRNQLAVSYLYLNRLPEAKAVLHETLNRWIDDGFALVHYGFILKTLDQNMELAAQYLQEGIETGHPGTQDGRFYFQLGDALQRLGRNDAALNVYRKGVQKKLFLSLYQRSLYNVDGLRSRPFWTAEQTTYATELELIRAQWTQVRDEGLKLLTAAGVFVNETENLRDRGDWKQLELFSRGTRIERNCARAPVTCRLVEQYFPAARSCKRGQVKFSVMHPGTHVWPHCGPTNCRIRAHLGLSVPQGTHIRVAEETRSWENGKWLIFDDSFEHEVWHNGTETRLVLIVDFWHPDLTESQRRSLSPI